MIDRRIKDALKEKLADINAEIFDEVMASVSGSTDKLNAELERLKAKNHD